MIGVVFFLLQIVGHWLKLTLWLTSNDLLCECKVLPVVLVRLMQAWLSAPCQTLTCQWKRLDFIFHDTEPALPSVRLSGHWHCAFSRPATDPSSSHCHPANTPKSCLGLLCPSTRGSPAEQNYTGKGGSDFIENIKCFTRIHSVALGVLFVRVWVCVCVWGRDAASLTFLFFYSSFARNFWTFTPVWDGVPWGEGLARLQKV